MGFIIRSNKEFGRLNKTAKVIKSADAWAYTEANTILERAELRRREILKTASELVEIEQKRGYKEGKESAMLEQTANMVSIVGKTVEYFSNIERQLVDLVMDAIQRIIDDFSEKEKILSVVKTALSAAKNQKQIKILIHPDNINFVHKEIEDLKKRFPGFDQIDINPDILQEKDSCIVQTEIGKIEASLTSQILALKASLSEVFCNASVDEHFN